MGARGLMIPRRSHLRFRWDDVGAAALRRFAQGEAVRCAALRALAIAQALEGASRAEAARLVGRERQSLRDAVVRYVEPRGSPDNAEGWAGLRNRPWPRRPGTLSPARQDELRAWVLAGPDPDVDGMSSYRLVDVAAHIEQRWSVSYGLSSVSRLLHRMGLSWQTTRPAHPGKTLQLWCEDEAREGQKGRTGHRWFTRGVAQTAKRFRSVRRGAGTGGSCPAASSPPSRANACGISLARP